MKNQFKLKHALLLLVGLHTQLFFAGEPAQGYMISKAGDTSQVTITVKTELLSKDIDFYRMQGEISYTDLLNKEGDFRATIVQEYGFTYQGKKYRYVSHPLYKNDITLMTDAFLKLEQDGDCKVYTFYDRVELYGMINIYERALLQKGKDPVCFVKKELRDKLRGLVNSMSTKEYFSDCQSVVKKLKDGDLKTSAPYAIANEYNQNCAH